MESIMSMDVNNDWYYPVMSSINLRFGEWLADRLFETDLTQAEFGYRIGVDQSTVSGWISGASRPRRNTCYKIADLFGVPRSEVVKLAGHKPSERDKLVSVSPAPEGPPGRSTEIPLRPNIGFGEDTEQVIRDITESVMARIGGFVSIRIVGRVPADSTRWAEWENEGRTMPVQVEWLGSRSPDQFYVLVASGDCMASRGIRDGAQVLIRTLDPGERPQSGKIVVVRIRDEYTLKVWSVEDGRTRLRDGDGNLVAELDNEDDVQVLGMAVRTSSEL